VASDIGVGFIGCGDIFERYVLGIRVLPGVRVVRVADVDLERARRRAEELAIPAQGTVDELLRDPNVDIVVDITPPQAHEATNLAAIAAGKHVLSEKPLATSLAAAKRVGEAAEAAGVKLGSAPEVFLGSAGQTARQAIDRGDIGEIVGASAFVIHTRLEEFHPAPLAFFSPGGGPALDMGPYFVTALVNCLGPVSRVGAMSRVGRETRPVTSPGRTTDSVDVTVPTHIVGALKFESGAMASIMLSFDVWPRRDRSRTLPFIEIYGTEGALSLADPDTTDGDVLIKMNADDDWRVIPPALPSVGPRGLVTGGFRGLAVADLMGALDGEPHRTHWSLAYHVLDVLLALEESGTDGSLRDVASRCERPAPVTTPWHVSPTSP
jgi:predicted dehydrogenase